MELPSFLHCEWPFTAQDLRSARTRSDQPSQVALAVSSLVHTKSNRLDRVRWIDRPVIRFVNFNQRSEHVETIGFGRSPLRFAGEIRFDLPERPIVIGFRLDRANVHFFHHTLSGSILSYSLCVPMNLISTRLKRYAMCTTRRYLFPPISKITRLSPTKSTFLPNLALMSAGPFHSARVTTAYQLRSGPSASG